MTYDTQEAIKTHEALQKSVRLFVYAAKPFWIMPNTGEVRGWKVLVEQEDDKPFWIRTYKKEFTEKGYHEVEYAQNSRGERYIKARSPHVTQ
jgi:hypothetical protein